MPTAYDMLAQKGFSVYYISPNATVLEAVERMNQLRVGAVVVMNDGHLLGMFTERDVLRRVVGAMLDPAKTKVEQVMTTDVVTCTPDADVDQISAMMKEQRVRHLPVREEDGDLLGLVSIGDVNATHAIAKDAKIEYLNEYLYGRA